MSNLTELYIKCYDDPFLWREVYSKLTPHSTESDFLKMFYEATEKKKKKAPRFKQGHIVKGEGNIVVGNIKSKGGNIQIGNFSYPDDSD